MRFAVLVLACWFAVFALAQVVQLAVVAVPPDLQGAFTRASAVTALIYAPILATIIHRPRKDKK